MDISEIIERLKDILATNGEIRKPKDSDVARVLGINPNTLAQAKFQNRIPYKAIMDFLHHKGISINTFFYGDDPNKIALQTNEYKILRLYMANASAGGGCINEEVSYKEVMFDTQVLAFLRIKECEIIVAIGDSMESEIPNNSLCLVSRQENTIKNGKLYAINTSNGLFVKQCFLQKDSLELKSLNPTYKSLYFPLQEVNVLGRIRGVISAL